MKKNKVMSLSPKIVFFVISLFFYPNIVKANIVDDTQSEFTSGTQLNTQWDSGNSWLEMNGTGLSSGFATFTSRIINVGESASWSTLSFIPQRPLLKELPNSGATETAYSEGNVSMSNNTLLYHFNNTSGNATDNSGNNRTGSATNITYSGLGRFNNAFTFNSNGLVNTGVVSSDLISFTTKTVSVWLYPTQAPAVNASGSVYYGQRVVGDDATYFGIYITQLTDDTQKIYAYNWSGSAQSVGTPYNLNEWIHIVLVHSDGTLYIYKNGSLAGSVSSATTNALASDLHIGDYYMSTNLYEGYIGKMDELALFNRALSEVEISDLYKRGALRAKYQVRSCDDALCSGEDFVGQSGSTSNFFEEQDSNTISLPSFSLSGVVASNQYFQYRTVFESSNASFSPEIKSITLETSGTEVGGGGGGGDVGIPEFSDFVYISTLLVGFFMAIKKFVPALRLFLAKKCKQKSVCI